MKEDYKNDDIEKVIFSSLLLPAITATKLTVEKSSFAIRKDYDYLGLKLQGVKPINRSFYDESSPHDKAVYHISFAKGFSKSTFLTQ